MVGIKEKLALPGRFQSERPREGKIVLEMGLGRLNQWHLRTNTCRALNVITDNEILEMELTSIVILFN